MSADSPNLKAVRALIAQKRAHAVRYRDHDDRAVRASCTATEAFCDQLDALLNPDRKESPDASPLPRRPVS